MVTTVQGDLFDSQAQTLVNTVNCVGVMGKGVAVEFRKRFPDMYEDYVQRCEAGKLMLGRPYLFRRVVPPWILNFPTKGHWRAVSRLGDIVKGLDYLEQHYREWGITSLAVPPLGSGQGQLEWRVVGPTLYRHLSHLDIPVELYTPYGASEDEIHPSFLEQSPGESGVCSTGPRVSKINPAWVALLEIVARIEHEPYHWPVGRTTFQKIAFFATESGLPTGLRYVKGSYGPFASELKPLLTRLVNNGLSREEKLGQMFAVKPGPTYPDAVRHYAEDLKRWEAVIDRIADLFLRMRTQQAEIAATVYFAARSLQAKTSEKPSEVDVLEEVKRWKLKRRPPLQEADVAQAIRSLAALHWLDVKPSKELPLPHEALANA
jgi:O-acetyl-ADP-ribose deacetylase (regulator of RNase III)/uncharacterized protein YwgA